MATSIKSQITTAMVEHTSLDRVKREFYKEKFIKEAGNTRFPITSRHNNTLDEAIRAFKDAGVDESAITTTTVQRYRKIVQEAHVSLPNLPLTISFDRSGLMLHHPFHGYGMDITYKGLTQVAEYFVRMSQLWQKWDEEWNELLTSCAKRAKLRTMSETSIETVLQDRLHDSGMDYIIKKQQYRVTLTLKMKHNVQATFIIQHSKFRQQLEKVLPAVQQLNDLMDDLGQPVKIKTLDRRANWQQA